MKVTIIDFSGKGGIGHYSYFLFKALKKVNPETTLITTSDFEFEIEEGILQLLPSHSRRKHKAMKGIVYLISLLKAFNYLLTELPDVIHFHELKIPLIELPLFYILSRNKMKIVLTSHNIFRAEAKFLSPFLKRLYKLMDGIIFHSEANREELFDRLDFISAKMWRTIPHGNYHLMVNPEMNRQKARKILEIDDDKFVVLFFGYIRKYKGLDILINAISKVRLSLKNIHLIIAGKDFENFKKYKHLIEKLDLENYVNYYCYYIPNNEISTFMEACDLVVLPYKKIFQSGVIQLSFAHAKPIIASQIGGIPDLVKEGKTGFLVKPGDPHILASAIENFFKLPENQRTEMGRNGRSLTKDLFSWEDIAKKTMDFYRDLV